jgi:hypothetical protein
MATERSMNMRILIALVVLALFAIITFTLAAATLGTLNKRSDALEQQLLQIDSKLSAIITTTTTTMSTTTSTLALNTTETATASPLSITSSRVA